MNIRNLQLSIPEGGAYIIVSPENRNFAVVIMR